MCLEAPKYSLYDGNDYFDIDNIAQHLINNYEFAYLDYTAGFSAAGLNDD